MPKCKECSHLATHGLLKKRTHCALHKTEGMKTLRGPICKEETCNKHASFGFLCEKKLSFCALHKEEGMVNHKWKRCCIPACKLVPCYASDKEVVCSFHRKPGMICTRPELARSQSLRAFMHLSNLAYESLMRASNRKYF